MSAANFSASLALVLKSEGGYVDDPRDPGGATNYGVTQAVYNHYRQINKASLQSVRSILQSEVAAIYRLQYWDPIKGDDLGSGIDYAAFDAAVNSGVVQAAKWLQAAIPVAPIDGQIGLGTLAALSAETNHAAIIKSICARRLTFLQRLKNWRYFGKGWSNRVRAVQAAALAMAG